MAVRREVLPGLCPNCKERPTDTSVEYYEVISLIYSGYSINRRAGGRSYRKTWVSGTARLCSHCASLYTRSVALRRRARPLGYTSGAVVVGGGLLYLIL